MRLTHGHKQDGFRLASFELYHLETSSLLHSATGQLSPWLEIVRLESLGTFRLELSWRLRGLAWWLPLGTCRMESFTRDLSLGNFAWGLAFGIYLDLFCLETSGRLRRPAWALLLGTFRLEYSA